MLRYPPRLNGRNLTKSKYQLWFPFLTLDRNGKILDQASCRYVQVLMSEWHFFPQRNNITILETDCPHGLLEFVVGMTPPTIDDPLKPPATTKPQVSRQLVTWIVSSSVESKMVDIEILENWWPCMASKWFTIDVTSDTYKNIHGYIILANLYCLYKYTVTVLSLIILLLL